MALIRSKPIVLTAANEEELYKQITSALVSVNANLKMFQACFPLELKNNSHTSFELCDENTRSIVTAFTTKIRKSINVDHPHIFLLWVPKILKTTFATADIRCKYLATGDEKAVGNFPLNEAFIFSFGWERSIRMKDAYSGKGLHLFIQDTCPGFWPNAPLGRLVPLWDNCATAKMRYTEDIGTSMTIDGWMRVKNVLSDKVTRGLLSSYMAHEFTCREKVEKFTGPPRVQLSDDLPETLDFTSQCSEVKRPPVLTDATKADEDSKVVSGNGVYEDLSTASKRQGQNTPTP
ncbi:putative movement protein 3a [Tulare apple mosaic virus]|uniref:Movement protein n=1 Tax=Tulare apple mosaic virus TaxID=151043 RepID=Q99HQ8_9BROM|nr:putative movement protein 3a [Tulare apple mosaic virus]AAK01484.1 putative movement protein 3a [Tulare apple mosaic virus]